jgi:multimeric flavodoxin WrbA
MKILALIGSPRKGGNTDIIVNQILEGAMTQGHKTTTLYLYDYEILPCIDCRTCKKGKLVCTLKDDMVKIYPELEKADLIIFGTPIYWYGPTAKMKLLIDRLRPFIANEKLKHKKALIVAPSAEGEMACTPLLEMFSMSFDYLGMQLVDKILITAYEKGEIAENKEEMNKAKKFGSSL